MEVEITFEPRAMGDHRDTLRVTSDVGGDFVVPVSGRCIAPKPIGPIMVSGSGKVQFRNPFVREVDFKLQLDNPAFSCSATERIGPKKLSEIAVGYKPMDGKPKEGKLTITCDEVDLPWVIYLAAT